MKKKVTILFAAFIFAASVSGCAGSNTDKEEATKTVDGFFAAMEEGNLKKAESYYTENCEDEFGINGLTDSADQILSSLNMGDTFNEESQEFIKKIVTESFESYHIDNVNMKDGKAVVDLSGICLDFENLTFDSADTDKLSEDYMNENADELAQIYLEKGNEGLEEAIMNGIVPVIYNELKKSVDQAGTEEYTAVMNLEEKDGRWLISAFERTA